MRPTIQEITELLFHLHDPVTGAGLIQSGRLTQIEWPIAGAQGDELRFMLELPPHARKRAEQIVSLCKASVAPYGVERVNPLITTHKPAGGEVLADVARIVMVCAGKGGVGKSFVTVALALALARMGLRVGVLDADITGASLPRMLGVARKPVIENGRMLPVAQHQLLTMSVGYILPADEVAIMRGPMLAKTLQKLLRGTHWGAQGEVDILMVDMPPGTSDIALSLAQQVPLAYNGGGAILVTTPQQLAVDDALKAAHMCKKLHVPIHGVIENMAAYALPDGTLAPLFGVGGGAQLASASGAPLYASVPFMPAWQQAADSGQAITSEVWDTLAARLWRSLGEELRH